MHKLCELLKRDHPDIAVTRPSLDRWSRRKVGQAQCGVAKAIVDALEDRSMFNGIDADMGREIEQEIALLVARLA